MKLHHLGGNDLALCCMGWTIVTPTVDAVMANLDAPPGSAS